MKKSSFLILIISLLFAFIGQSQTNWRYINKENISFKMPENWQMINSSKKRGETNILINDPNSEKFVEIKSVPNKINLKDRATDVAELRSHKANFDYMQIDKVKKDKFNGLGAQHLIYTNTVLNEVSKGNIYAFVKEGYTYTVEYYGADNKQEQEFLQQIVSTINVNSADKKENITDESKTYVSNNWANQEVDRSAEIAAQAEKEAIERANKEALEARKNEQKEQIKAEKRVAKEAQKLKEQQEKLKKQQEKLEKKEQEAKEAKKKAEKKAALAEKKRIEKENKIKELRSRQKDIEKELNSIASDQIKLSKEYGKLQQKNETKKMEKVQNKIAKLTEKTNKLSKERDQITKTLSKF